MRALFLPSSILILVIAACGDDDDSPVDAGLDAEMAAGDGSSRGDSSRDAMPDADAIPMPTAGTGYVFAQRQAGSMSNLYVSFEPFEATAGRCESETFDVCRIERCVETMMRRSAGTVTVTGGETTITAMPSAGGQYTSTAGGDIAPGAAVRFTAAGGDVPMFAADTEMPNDTRLIAPAVPDNVLTVGAGPLDVQFDAVDVGELVFALSSSSGSDRFTLKCSFPASSGRGRVPSEGLAAAASFSRAHTDARMRLVWFVEDYRRLSVGEWEVRVAARAESHGGDVVFSE